MSGTQHLESSSRRGPRSRWSRPEDSCGDFVTTLQDGKHVWVTIGPAAIVWQSLSGKIRTLVQHKEFLNVGVSFFIYMIGRDKSTASPRIIFCSSDAVARKNLRKLVRESDILSAHPSIGLGDSSSPLVRSDSGIQTPSPASSHPRQTQNLQAPGKTTSFAYPLSGPASKRAASSSMNQYWLPNQDIHKKVITQELQYYLGPDATVRPFTREVRGDFRSFRALVFLLTLILGRRWLPHHYPRTLPDRCESSDGICKFILPRDADINN